MLQVIVHFIGPIPLAANHLNSEARPVVHSLVKRVDEGERGDCNEENNEGGDNGPSHLESGVVEQLLSQGTLIGVVKLGGKLEEHVAD